MERGSFIFMSIPYVPPIRLFFIYYLEKISSQRYEPIRPRVRERNCRHPACVLRHTVASVMTTRDRLCMVLEQNRTPDKPIQCTGHDSVHRDTSPTGHLTNQSNIPDVIRFTQRVGHVALYQRALRLNPLVSCVSI
jgi:hypothetical protein